MAPLIRIGKLDALEADQLADALAVRGLAARVAATRDWQCVEVYHHHEELGDMLPDLISALGDWLNDSTREQMELAVGDDELVVRRSDDLQTLLRARISQAQRQARR